MRITYFAITGLLIATGLRAQVPDGVRIDDPRVRVIVATEQPHKPSELHEHKMNRVMIYLGDGEMTYKSAAGKVERIKFKKGDVKWNPAMGPHISENVGAKAFQMVEIELLNTPQSPPPVLSKMDPLKLDLKHYRLEFENAQTRVLRVRFGPNEKGVEHEHTYSNVVVYLNDQARGKTGEARLDGPRTHTEENALDHPVERISVELK
jgi:quercetin dioxygenase-like cupin family protein